MPDTPEPGILRQSCLDDAFRAGRSYAFFSPFGTIGKE